MKDEKQNKINKAIEFGFIIRHLDSDGLYRYELTDKGKLQWMSEIVNKRYT